MRGSEGEVHASVAADTAVVGAAAGARPALPSNSHMVMFATVKKNITNCHEHFFNAIKHPDQTLFH